MKTIAKLALCAVLLPAVGCIPDWDYAGEYEMTYDVVMSPAGIEQREEVRAGLATVEIRPGQRDEHLIDLGASFCLLIGQKIWPTDVTQVVHLEVAPQACWFTHGDATYPLSLGGTVTYDYDSERTTIVLAGSYSDEANKSRGSLTVEMTETW
jgi:hypothetical protein